MIERIRFIANRLSERLWVRPLLVCLLSIAAAFLCKVADYYQVGSYLPDISFESLTTLLDIISSSMLVIATFAVASMVSAYASAGSNATPRSFALVIADDVSQNALSTFIGAFIFSIVALLALKNDFYDKPALFALFVITVSIFAVVISTFVRWVDSVARLGRLGTTIDKVEKATDNALQKRRRAPFLGGVVSKLIPNGSEAVFSQTVGYVQLVDVAGLQNFAERFKVRVSVTALPGTFNAPGKPLAYLIRDEHSSKDYDSTEIAGSFTIGCERKFHDDPRFGLIVLSEIAGRALSPGINDPGTAIDIIGRFIRIFSNWSSGEEEVETETKFELVEVPALCVEEMFSDAFTAIARDGAGSIEVAIRLQKAFQSLMSIGDNEIRRTAIRHSKLALARAEKKLEHAEDLEKLREVAKAAPALAA